VRGMMNGNVKKTLALPFEPGQVIGVSGIRPDGTLTKRSCTGMDKAAAVIERHPEDREL
jgi:hypothetical protein